MSSQTVPRSRPIKRRKTTRACDNCRAHKLRCESKQSDECEHCKDYGLPCTKVLPAPIDTRKENSDPRRSEEDSGQGFEPGFLGKSRPSSLAHLVATLLPKDEASLRALNSVDARHDYYRAGEDNGKREDVILVGRDTVDIMELSERWSFAKAQEQLSKEIASSTVIESLLLTVQTRIIPIFPIISVTESVSKSVPPAGFWSNFSHHEHNSTPHTPLPGIVRLAHIAIATLDRNVPRMIRQAALHAVHAALQGEEMSEVEQQSSIANIQSLLLLSMSPRLHPRSSVLKDNKIWQRVGTGIRMALDIGLHRKMTSALVPVPQLHRRSRVWGACVILDAWLAVSLGQMKTLDLDQCDAPFPFAWPDHLIEPGPNIACFSFFSHLTMLSSLLGEAYKLTNSPSGLRNANDLLFYRIQRNFDSWREQLPTSWPYNAKLSTPEARPLLNLFACCTEFILLRPFVSPCSQIPEHISFRPRHGQWEHLVEQACEAIAWAETPGGTFFVDVWFLTGYPLAICTVITYLAGKENVLFQAWTRRGFAVLRDWAGYSEQDSELSEIRDLLDILQVGLPDSEPFLSNVEGATDLELFLSYLP